MSCDNSMVPVYNITGLPQGSDIILGINYKAGSPVATLDLSSGFSAMLHVRQNYDEPVLIELSTSNGTIILGDTSPNIKLFFKRDLTSGLTVYENLIYDLELFNEVDNLKNTILKGNISIDREITK